MTLDEIQANWELDCDIDTNHLDTESVKTAKLHSKYIKLLVDAKLRISKLRIEYQEIKKLKFRYYRGELSRQELTDLNWEQWQYAKPIKNEMEQLLDGDSDITKIKMKIEYIDTMIYLLESILKSIADRTWSIKNSITFKQFLAGS
jgi:hypothetical protein